MSLQAAITDFRAHLRGELIEPGHSRYEEARQVYNGMISRKPRLIAQCVDEVDVVTSVGFGHRNGLRVAIRGGGHNAGGLGVCDDGLVIDLSPIKYVHVDEAKKPLAWRCRRASSRPPALAVSPLVAASDT
jgi:FAD/FMN-containing dehydrogenase